MTSVVEVSEIYKLKKKKRNLKTFGDFIASHVYSITYFLPNRQDSQIG